MKIYNPSGFSSKLTGSFSGSFVGDGSNITSISSDNINFNFTALSSSAQIADDISGSFTSTSQSLASRVASQESFSSSLDNTFATDADLNLVSSSVDSLNAATSSYLQNTTDTLTGNLTVTGTITAQDLHVQEITSSIVYSSGSNVFGENVSDTQTFNGSLQVSGSTNYLLGSVGIGTTSPASKLETKDGDIRVTTLNSFSNLVSGRAAIPNAGGYNLGGLLFQAYRTGTTYNTGAAIYSYADGAAWTSTSVPSYLSFHTAASGATSTTERMRIDSSGLVKIGTSATVTPYSLSKFVIDTGTYTYMDLLSTNSAGINFGDAGGAQIGVIEYDHSSNFMRFSVASGERMRINSSGYVGIGTTTISARLNTNKAVEGSWLAYLEGTSATFDAQPNIAVVHDSSALGTGTAAGIMLVNNDETDYGISPIIGFSAKSASTNYNHTYAAIYGQKLGGGADSNWNRGGLSFATGHSTGPIVRLHINSDGFHTMTGRTENILRLVASSGSPAILRFNTPTTTADPYFAAYGNELAYGLYGSGEKIRIDGNGNVGIGTTSPASKLHINAASGTADLFAIGDAAIPTSGTEYGVAMIKTNSTEFALNVTAYNANSQGARFYSHGTQTIFLVTTGLYGDVFKIDGGGFVGIGRTSPVSILELGDDTPTLTISDTGNNYNDGDVQAVVHLSGRWYSGTANPASDNYSDARIVLRKNSGDGTGGSSLAFETSANGSGGLVEAIRIDKSQNVGINETAPAAKLQVSGDRDGVSEYVAVLGEDGGANGAANSGNTTPVHKTLLTGYSIPYSGQTNARLTSVGFLEFDSTPGWTGNQRNYALTSGYDMGGTGGPKFAILMGNAQNVEPQLGTNGAVGSGTGDGANTRVCSYWDNGGNLVVPEGSITVNSGVYIGGTTAANNLDDYEEGSWTPQVYYQNATDQSNATNTVQEGKYTKIGNLVYVSFRLDFSQSSGSPANDNIGVKNLPFAGANNHYGTNGNAVTTTSVKGLIFQLPTAGGTLAVLVDSSNGGNYGDDFGTGSGKIIRGSFTYQAQ